MLISKFPIQHKIPHSMHLYLEFTNCDNGDIKEMSYDISFCTENFVKKMVLELRMILKRINFQVCYVFNPIYKMYELIPCW
jgi:hypothetical protein